MRLIIEMESKLTFQSVIKPTTPTSIDKIEKATQSEQMGLGIRTKETNIIMTTATLKNNKQFFLKNHFIGTTYLGIITT